MKSCWKAQLLSALHTLERGRRTVGLSQQDLAEQLGVSRRTISRIERGETSPASLPVGLLADWAAAVGLTLCVSITNPQEES